VVSRVEGLVLLLGFVAVLAFLLARASREDARVRIDVETFSVTHTVLWMNLLRFAVAAALLYYGARFVLQGAPMIGAQWGLSPLLTGLLPVAIGTALPEIAAAMMAARRGQGDMVAGHVIGSSLLNLLVVVGGMAAFRPMALPASFVRLELPAAIAFVLVLYPMLRGDLRISRVEGGLLLAAFVGWVVLEVALLA
jgi:cation:H+ antiporter